MFTLHKTPWKTTLYQTWTKTFNPNCLAGMKLLMWISLCMLPLKYKQLHIMVATQVGIMLGFDISNKWRWDRPFYIVMNMDQRWVEYVEIPRFDGLNVEVNVHYEQFIIRCWVCANMKYLVHECQILGGWQSTLFPMINIDSTNIVERQGWIPPQNHGPSNQGRICLHQDQCAHRIKELNPFLGGHLDTQVFKNLQAITIHKWFLKGGMD